MGTRHRTLAAVIAVVVVVTSLGVFFGYRAYSQGASVVTVNGQDIPVGFYDDMQTREAVLSTRYPGYFEHIGNINNLIQQVLIDQEAQRRGLACSTQDANNFIGTQVANLRQVGRVSDFLLNADLFGAVPPGWEKTPEPARTPSVPVALATYVANPSVVLGYQDICTTGRLYSAVTPKNATNEQRNAAIDLLLAQLRKSANITTGGSVPVASPTPYNTPVPTATRSAPLQNGPLEPTGARIAVGTP